MDYMNKWSLGIRLFALLILCSITLYNLAVKIPLIIESVYAKNYNCSGDCSFCQPDPKKGYEECDQKTNPDAEYACCWDEDCDGNCLPWGDGTPDVCPCTNHMYICKQITTTTPTPTPSCSCSETSCPIPTPPSKWRQKPVDNGTRQVCDPVDKCIPPTSVACEPSYINSAPICSILPNDISLVRGESPMEIKISAHDDDYGDTVEISGFEVVGNDNLLKNCVHITKTDGGAIAETVIKRGSEDEPPEDRIYDGSVQIKVDQNAILGVYESMGTTSKCEGTLNIEVKDVALDAGDISEFATCSIHVKVTNEYPKFEGAELLDQGAGPKREGNLLETDDGKVYIGSNVSNNKVLKVCKEPLNADGTCPSGSEEMYNSTKNPIDFSFTISDANGRSDILEAGIWLQKYEQSDTSPSFPVAENGSRNSIQALYSDRRDIKIKRDMEIGTLKFFNTPGCSDMQDDCVPNKINDTEYGIFSAIEPIVMRNKPGNGNISDSPYRASPLKQWLEHGFPSCQYLTAAGCGMNAVPEGSLVEADSDLNNGANYNWSIGAKNNQQLCYKNDGSAEAVATGNGCPTDCAACIERLGITEVDKIPNSFKFDFRITINDKDDSSAGLDDGKYLLFLHASDKVNAQIDNGTYWGQIIVESKKPRYTNDSKGTFVYHYDATSPEVGDVILNAVEDSASGVRLSTVFTDPGGKTSSGLKGIANRALIKVKDGQVKGYLTKGEDLEITWNGQKDVGNLSTEFIGYGLTGGTQVKGNICVYDNANNVGCDTNGSLLEAQASWLKTSMGDVYTKRTGSDSGFSMTLPPENKDATSTLAFYEKVLAPFRGQKNSIVTGMVITGGEQFGINGGRTFDGFSDTYPFGSSTSDSDAAPGKSYRTNQVGGTFLGEFAWRGFVDRAPQSNWYPVLRDTVYRRCDVLGDCKTGSALGLVSSDEGKYKIVVLSGGSATIDASGLICRGVNVIFIENLATLTIAGDITKANSSSSCMFIVSSNSSLIIEDPTTGDSPDEYSDKFEASVVVTSAGGVGGRFITKPGAIMAKQYDRLDIYGFVYSTLTTPVFGRDLVLKDNLQYPAEWIIYDANVLDNYREILGITRSYDIVCGTSNSIFCK